MTPHPTWTAVLSMAIAGVLQDRRTLALMRTPLNEYNDLAATVGGVPIPANDRDAVRLLLAAGDDDQHALWDGVARLDAMESSELVRRGAA